MTFRVSTDLERCQGHGKCVIECPEVFDADEQGYVVVLAPHLGAMRNTRHFLEVAKTLGYSEDRMCFVLNRANTSTDLALSDIASVIGTRRIFQLPSAGPQPTQAANHGRGYLEEQPRTPLAKALQALAEHVRLAASDLAVART